MHEMSFAEQIIDVVEREAQAYPGGRVTRIKLRAGEALALEPASLRFAIEALSVDTPMAGAQVELYEDAQGGMEVYVEEIELDD